MSSTTVKQHYQDSQVAERYDRERFSSFVGRTFDRLEKRALRWGLAMVKRDIPNPETLDVPCGTGRVTELWLEEGLNVMGGDISLQMISVAERKCRRFSNKVEFRQLDLDGLEIEDDAFDLVTCIRLFHHIGTTERAAILQELARVSRRFVLINVSLSTPYYRLRRKVKSRLGQGVSRTSSTWDEIRAESSHAGLHINGTRMILPGVSEDMVVLLEKTVEGHWP